MRLRLPLLGWLLCSCVLPDFHVVSTSQGGVAREPDAAVMPAAMGMAALAPPECSSCAAAECGEQRSACGEGCDELPWPLSPASTPASASRPYVECIASKCDAQCNVLWGCVEAYSWAQPSDAYNVKIHVDNSISGAEVVGARVTACQGSDPGCGVGSGMESSDMTDEGGDATLTLDANFFGYFLIEPNDPKYYPMTMMWSQPIYRVDRTFTIGLFERPWVDVMADTLGVTKNDDTAGHMIFHAQNCLPVLYLDDVAADTDADDVVVSCSPKGPDSSRVFYTRYAVGVDPTLDMTKKTGGSYGGALNLLPGALTLVGSYNERDIAHATIRMRRNTLALVHLVPDGR